MPTNGKTEFATNQEDEKVRQQQGADPEEERGTGWMNKTAMMCALLEESHAAAP